VGAINLLNLPARPIVAVESGARGSCPGGGGSESRQRTERAKRLKALEQENSRLKRLVADLSLDNA
jgi:hypothetical protein